MAKTSSPTALSFWSGVSPYCEISSSRSSSYTMAQSTSRMTSCIIAEGTETWHFPRSVVEDLHHSPRFDHGSGHGHTNGFHHWHWNLLEHLLCHDLRHWNVHCLQLRRWIWSLDNLRGGMRHGHWLLNGQNLRHVSSFHHLRRDPRHGNGDLIDVFDQACDVTHAVTQLLFPSFDTQRLQTIIGILESTDHCAFAVVAIKLELRVLLEVRSALVHIVTAVHSTSGTRTRPQDVDWALVHHESATIAPLPLVVCLVAVVLWSRCCS